MKIWVREMSGPMSGFAAAKNKPDIGLPFRINGLEMKCRKCRVFSSRVTPWEFGMLILGVSEQSADLEKTTFHSQITQRMGLE